jgi:UDP-N-acetylmuramyl pentapeptide synthase
VTLAIPGRHHVSNALVALAIAHRCGIAPTTAATALAGSAGLAGG